MYHSMVSLLEEVSRKNYGSLLIHTDTLCEARRLPPQQKP